LPRRDHEEGPRGALWVQPELPSAGPRRGPARRLRRPPRSVRRARSARYRGLTSRKKPICVARRGALPWGAPARTGVPPTGLVRGATAPATGQRNGNTMLGWALKKILGTSHEREVKRMRPRVEA